MIVVAPREAGRLTKIRLCGTRSFTEMDLTGNDKSETGRTSTCSQPTAELHERIHRGKVQRESSTGFRGSIDVQERMDRQ